MAAETKTSVAARFVNHAYVSAGDFSTLIDSYQDASDVLLAIATAAQGGGKGMVYVSGSATVSFQSAAAEGLLLLNTATTAAAQQMLGGGAAGRVVFEAVTTASSQTALGGGTVGRTLFEAVTTSNSQDALGAGSFGKELLATTTTAQARNKLSVIEVGTTVEFTLSASPTTATYPHGLGGYPTEVLTYLEFLVSAHGYAIGDRQQRSNHIDQISSPANIAAVSFNATNIRWNRTTGAFYPVVIDTAGQSQTLSDGQVKVRLIPIRLT